MTLFYYQPLSELVLRYTFTLLDATLTTLTLVFMIFGVQKNMKLVDQEEIDDDEIKRMSSLAYKHRDTNILNR